MNILLKIMEINSNIFGLLMIQVQKYLETLKRLKEIHLNIFIMLLLPNTG